MKYGIVSAEQRKEMTGLEFVQGMVEGTLPHNTMAGTLGYQIVEAEKGRVVVTALPKDTHLNPHGTVHGGLAATMLDSCMGLAIMTLLDKGVGSTTLEFKISFIRAITPETGLIRAEGNRRWGRACQGEWAWHLLDQSAAEVGEELRPFDGSTQDASAVPCVT